MSRQKLKARDKAIQKMSRDGAILVNTTTGDEQSISKREAELDLRNSTLERQTLSQLGTRFDGKSKPTSDIPNTHKKTPQRYSDPLQKQEIPYSQKNTTATIAPQSNIEQHNNVVNAQKHQPPAVISDNPHGTSKLKNRNNEVYQEPQTTTIQHESALDASPLQHQSERLTFSENKAERHLPNQKDGKHKKQRNTKYKQKQSTDIRHEPQKTDSTSVHTEGIKPSADAIVNEPDSKSKFKIQRETALRHNQPETKIDPHSPASETPSNQKYEVVNGVYIDREPLTDVSDVPHDQLAEPTNKQANPVIRQNRKGKFNQNRETVYRHNKTVVLQDETQKVNFMPSPKCETEQNTQHPADTADNKELQPKSQADTADNKALQAQSPEEKSSLDKPNKDGKLQFADDEIPLDQKKNRKLEKAEQQAEKAGEKLEKSKNKLPVKRKLRTERVFDEQKGKAIRRLYFEKEVTTQAQHLKGALPLRPVKASANTLMLKAHSKIYQVEHENVAVKASHRAEMIGEAGLRSALHHYKTAPYRKAAKLEKQSAKKTIKLNYQKALADNPKIKSNMLSRMLQKRKIKKDYAKATRDAKKAAKTVKKAGSVTSEAAKLLAGTIRRHPIATAVIILIALLLFVFMSLIGMSSGIGSGGLSAILSSSYLAEDADIEQAELSYSEWETDLQLQILNAENSHPGYDEYRYDVGDISHNPYELMAYLTAVYYNYTYDGLSSDLQALFDEQYTLSFDETIETRYADPTDANDDGDYEPYDWHVMTIKLTTRSFSEVILSKMTADQQEHYALLMQTKGNRQFVGNPFDIGWLPYVTSYYGYRVHPITGEKDLHRAVDIALPLGTPIKSTQDGTVTFAGNSGGYGNVVIIENDKGITTKYAHCDTISVSVGQIVSMGDTIATVGNTGVSTGAHLHYEVLKDGEYFNPLLFTDTGSYNLLPSYGIPGAPMGDGSYAALIAEAESHLGKPYVFGANGPNSFDCSSFICYILTQSGVKNMPRTTAQGIYNQCTPIPTSERQPGDLVFFHSTYSTVNTVTHVALYVGDGWIIHAGSPVQYTQIDGNSYWQSHLYSYGRLN